MMEDIKLFKLVTGEEVLAEVLPGHPNSTRLKNPVRVAMVPGATGPSVGFAPFPTFAPQTKNSHIDISDNMIVYSYVPEEDFIMQYNQIFGSGIIVPSKQILNG